MTMKKKMEASTSKEYGDFAKLLEDELMSHTADFQDGSFGTYAVERSEKIHEPVEAEHSDTTECSTSYDDSDCGVDASGEAEVSSDFGGAESASGKLFTKRRKLSSHWRMFIHPLMWRCKWVELQIKKLDAQARVYDRKLQENLVQFENAGSEVVWRKRRQRAEATNDMAAYMSRHNLFSYYEHRKYIREISHNVLKNPVRHEEAKSDVDQLGNEEGGDCDNDLADILGKLDALQWRVLKLKSRVVVEVEEEEEEEEGDDSRSPIWQNAPLNSPPSPATGYHRMPVGTYIASQLLAEYNLGGVLLPGSTGLSHGETATDRPRSAHAYQNEDEDDDDVLIDNHRVRDELRYFQKVKIHSIKRPLVVVKDASATTSHEDKLVQI